MKTQWTLGTTHLELTRGDITRQEVDAIVNAANSALLGGGGVDGAIHRVGGPAILEACKAIRARQGKCATGEAVITPAGRLKAERVIHTVGPVWHGGERGEPELLARCYRNSLALARTHGLRSVAFPSISTGAYRYPIEQAAGVAIRTIAEAIERHADAFDRVRMVLFSEADHRVYVEAATRWAAERGA